MNIFLHWKKIGLILLVMVLGTGFYSVFSTSESTPEDPVESPKKIAQLEPAAALITDEVITTTLGTVQSIQDVDLRSEASGQIIAAYVDTGSVVDQGQVLLELDRQVLDAQLQQAQARLAAAQATLEKLRNGDRPEDIQILQQQIAAEEQRLQEMKRGVRQEEIDITETQLANAYRSLEDAQNELENTEQKAKQNSLSQKEKAVDVIKNTQAHFEKTLSQHLQQVISPVSYPNNETCRLNDIISIAEDNIMNECFLIFRMTKDHNEFIEGLAEAATMSPSELLEGVELSKERAEQMRVFLSSLLEVVNAVVAINKPGEGSFSINDEELLNLKSPITTAQNENQTLIMELTNQITLLRDLDLTNKTAIDAAQSKVTSAENSILSLEKELVLKKSSSSAEQIAIQASQIEQLRIQLKVAQEGARPEDIRNQEASVQQAQADVAVAIANRNKAIISAPFAGTIIEFPFQQGDYINTGDTVALLTNPEQLEIITFVSEDERRQIQLGTEVQIGDTNAKGYVEQISPALERNTKKIEVSIDVYEAADELVIGQTVFVGFELDLEDDALRIPLSAVKVSGTEAVVYSVDKEHQIAALPVDPGKIYGDSIVVVGITPDQLILPDTNSFEVGQAVQVQSSVEFEVVDQLYPEVTNRYPELLPQVSEE